MSQEEIKSWLFDECKKQQHRITTLLAVIEQCGQPLSALLSCFESQHDESGLHQPTEPIQAVDYEAAQEALSAIKKVREQ